jgi:hypothetical protein
LFCDGLYGRCGSGLFSCYSCSNTFTGESCGFGFIGFKLSLFSGTGSGGFLLRS